MNDNSLSDRENLNIQATNKLLLELDKTMEDFIESKEAEIVKLCHEKEALGMDEEFKFVSPFRTWCYSIFKTEDSCKNVVKCTVFTTRLKDSTDEEMLRRARSQSILLTKP